MPSKILTVSRLTKEFTNYERKGVFNYHRKETTALKNFSLSIPKPTILGLVGPNGAGKTTFIKTCLGLIKPTKGKVQAIGFDPYQKTNEFMSQAGFVSGQKRNLKEDVSAQDSLKISGYLYNMNTKDIQKRIDEFVKLFQLESKLHTPVRKLSLGERMKFEIISSILHQPRLLLMDEPSIGLDFESQNLMRELLKKIYDTQDVSIIITSHYLPDITELCERIVVIEQGKKEFDGDLTELKKLSKKQGYLKSLINEINKPKYA